MGNNEKTTTQLTDRSAERRWSPKQNDYGSNSNLQSYTTILDYNKRIKREKEWEGTKRKLEERMAVDMQVAVTKKSVDNAYIEAQTIKEEEVE